MIDYEMAKRDKDGEKVIKECDNYRNKMWFSL